MGGSKGSSGGAGYSYKGSGVNSQGNHWCSRDYGTSASNQNSYHYSNNDGSYYYSNPDGSTYYESSNGTSVYTFPEPNESEEHSESDEEGGKAEDFQCGPTGVDEFEESVDNQDGDGEDEVNDDEDGEDEGNYDEDDGGDDGNYDYDDYDDASD